MKRNLVTAGLIAGAFAASIFASPYYTLYQMKRAIAAKDAASLGDYVDFPALRESVKGQLLGVLNDAMPTEAESRNPFNGLGKMLGAAVIGPMVDTLVSPAGLVALMSREGRKDASDSSAGNVKTSRSEKQTNKPNYSVSYNGWSTVSVSNPDHRNDGARFILKRQGLWGWKLTSVELPKDALKLRK